MSTSKRIYGIDLGTTYSCIAFVEDNGNVRVLENQEGQLTTPSVVYIQSPSDYVVGSTAKDAVPEEGQVCIETIKREMGNPDWKCEVQGRVYHPQEISALILKKLAADAENITGEPVTDVVITCPAYFGVVEKEATKQAGILAGLTVHNLIPEPMAAAVAYAMAGGNDTREKTVLVYDLGGGTFDVTIMKMGPSGLETVCTGGDHTLGGKDWDELLIDWLVGEFCQITGYDKDEVLGDAETYRELKLLAESTKIKLSSMNSCKAKVMYQGDRQTIEVTREKFDELTLHKLEETIRLTQELIEVAKGKGVTQIDECLLVGGSTYMPQVKAALGKNFSFEFKQYDPNQAVAKGAAIYARNCALRDQVDEVVNNTDDPEAREEAVRRVAQETGLSIDEVQNAVDKPISNVTAKSFGTLVFEGTSRLKVCNLIVAQSTLPCKVSDEFYAASSGQKEALIRCVENTAIEAGSECNLYEDDPSCRHVGEVTLKFGQAVQRGTPVQITFELTEEGLLKVYGHIPSTGARCYAELKTDSLMSEEELEQSRSALSRSSVV